MGNMRRARECGLQALFQLEADDALLRVDDVGTAITAFLENFEVPDRAGPYAEKLARGVYEHRDEIDGLLREHSTRWKLERMARTDRNALRIGVYEMLWEDEVPRNVAIDEAIELGKRFGTEGSGAFVNGVLGAIARTRSETPEKTDP
jgi:N utilization substance protein B